MYHDFYKLSAMPFALPPDADFLYPSARHRRAIATLEYGITTQAGFVVITGEVGAGKTTLIRRYLKSAHQGVVVGVITNSSSTLGRLMHWISSAFSLDTKLDDIALYNQFIDFLLAQYAEGKRTILIVDEAQNLSVDMLEELRMLSNVNNEKDQLLQIILVGQPELLETLNRRDLRQLAQRIVVHCHLDPMLPRETAAYIRHRLSVVGGSADIFDDSACAAVHYFTGGIPRLINLLSDQSLLYGYAEDLKRISYPTVSAVVDDRSRSGLTSYVNKPVGWSLDKLPYELQILVEEMKKGAA